MQWKRKQLVPNENMDKIKSKFSSSDFALRELSKFEWLKMTAAAAETASKFAASGSVLTTTNTELLNELFLFSRLNHALEHYWA